MPMVEVIVRASKDEVIEQFTDEEIIERFGIQVPDFDVSLELLE